MVHGENGNVVVKSDITDTFGSASSSSETDNDIRDMFGSSSEDEQTQEDDLHRSTSIQMSDTVSAAAVHVGPTKSKPFEEADTDIIEMFGTPNRASISRKRRRPHGKARPTQQQAASASSNPTPRFQQGHDITSSCRSQWLCTSSTASHNTSSATAADRMKQRLAASILSQKRIQPLEQQRENISDAANTITTSGHGCTFYRQVKLEHYWKNIRDWDFVHALNQTQQKYDDTNPIDHPTTIQEKGTSPCSDQPLSPLPDTFDSCSQYKALWSPLLLKEVHSQMLTDVSSSSEAQLPMWRRGANIVPVQVECLIPTASIAQDSVTLSIRMNLPTNGVDVGANQTTRKGGKDRERQCFFNDVVLLVPQAATLAEAANGRLINVPVQQPASSPFIGDDDTITSSDGPAETKRKRKNRERRQGLLGHVVNRVRTFDGLAIQVSYKLWCSVGKTQMFLAKLGGNVTSLREFTALCRADEILLKRYLLSGNMQSQGQQTDTYAQNNASQNKAQLLLSERGGDQALGIGFRIYIKSKFNPSQIGAITAAARDYGHGGFTLVKGPPGTGKTTTLVALLNSLHLRQYQIYYQEIEKIAKTQQESALPISMGYMTAFDSAARVKPRILVCGPSNSAIDNVITKITQDRFVDGNGGKYNPSIVRVGVGQSADVRNVSLQTQIDSVLIEGADYVKLESLIAFCREELLRFQTEIKQLQQRIRALATAVSPLAPLSRDWEIRIDETTFRQSGSGQESTILFVNHKLKTTTHTAPLPAEPGEIPHPTEEMPHYRSLMDTLVKYVERHNSTTSKLKQYRLLKETTARIQQDGRNSHAANCKLQELESHLLNSAHIVCTTLGTAGSKAIESAAKFEVVVVDEAAQSSEPATLVALQLGSSHAVLMGDPQQLPATVFSISGRKTKFDRSLFQRLEEAGHPVHLLDTQYRMHPSISNFPRRIFYDGRLLDGRNVKDPLYGGVLRKTLRSKFPSFQPFTILDLDSAEERGGTSLSNNDEVELALHLYSTLDKETSGMVSQSRVAIITPYSQQADLLRKRFEEFFGRSRRMPLDISTVDAFQGKEADIVIFSCVRAAGNGATIGFLSDVQRMNVALTRAKHFLFVIARVRTISVNPYWRDLAAHAKEVRSIIRVPSISNGRRTGERNAQINFPPLAALKPVHVAPD